MNDGKQTSDGVTSQFVVNAKDIRKTSDAIQGHDRALQNIREDISAFKDHLEALVEDQSAFADNLKQVNSVQRKMAQAQERLSDELGTIAEIADEKVPAATSQLHDTLAQVRNDLNELVDSLRTFLRKADSLAENFDPDALERASQDVNRAVEAASEHFETQLEELTSAAREHIDSRFTEVVDKLETALNEQRSAVLVSGDRIDQAAQRLQQTCESFDARIQHLENRMEEFEEQTAQTVQAIETQIEEREQRLDNQEEAVDSMFSRIKNMLGN